VPLTQCPQLRNRFGNVKNVFPLQVYKRGYYQHVVVGKVNRILLSVEKLQGPRDDSAVILLLTLVSDMTDRGQSGAH
jgi:hypothetical protein